MVDQSKDNVPSIQLSDTTQSQYTRGRASTLYWWGVYFISICTYVLVSMMPQEGVEEMSSDLAHIPTWNLVGKRLRSRSVWPHETQNSTIRTGNLHKCLIGLNDEVMTSYIQKVKGQHQNIPGFLFALLHYKCYKPTPLHFLYYRFSHSPTILPIPFKNNHWCSAVPWHVRNYMYAGMPENPQWKTWQWALTRLVTKEKKKKKKNNNNNL